MAKEHLISFIDKHQKRGYDRKTLTSILLKHKYPLTEINEAFDSLSNNTLSNNAANGSSSDSPAKVDEVHKQNIALKHKSKKNVFRIHLFILLCLILLLLVVLGGIIVNIKGRNIDLGADHGRQEEIQDKKIADKADAKSIDKTASRSDEKNDDNMASLERPDAKPSIICTMIRVESLANNFMSESEKLPIRCFFSNLEGCNPASVTVIDGERISDVSIKDEKRGYCILSINEYTSVKGYTCKVPDDFWTLNSVEDDIMAGADVLRMILSTPEDDELKVYGISCKI